MKHISEILDKNPLRTETVSHSGDKESSVLVPEAQKLVINLFKILEVYYSYFAYDNFSSQDDYDFARREWTKCFIARNVRKEDIERGVKRIRETAMSGKNLNPNEFLALCEVSSEELGMPPVEKAYEQACRNSHPCETDKKWAHDAVRLAWTQTGSFNLRTESKAKTFPVFAKNYKAACKEYAEGRAMNRIADTKTPMEYQEYVGRIKSDIFLGLQDPNTHIMKFDDWRNHNGA